MNAGITGCEPILYRQSRSVGAIIPGLGCGHRNNLRRLKAHLSKCRCGELSIAPVLRQIRTLWQRPPGRNQDSVVTVRELATRGLQSVIRPPAFEYQLIGLDSAW